MPKSKNTSSKLFQVALSHAEKSGLKHPDPSDSALTSAGITRNRWFKLCRDLSSATLHELDALAKMYRINKSDLI